MQTNDTQENLETQTKENFKRNNFIAQAIEAYSLQSNAMETSSQNMFNAIAV